MNTLLAAVDILTADCFLALNMAGLTGDTSQVGFTLGAASRAGQDINDTYYRLATIAALHGARVPQPVAQ